MTHQTNPSADQSAVSVKESVNRQFSQAADNYATSKVHAAGEDLQEMVRFARLSGSERVLDAGCGAGHTALTFAPHVAEVVAYDLSTAMLAQVDKLAKDRGLTNIRTEEGDVEALPFADGSFDLVVSRYSAHHWPAPTRALAEIRRVLKPGGSFLLSDIVSFDDFTTDTFLQAMELLRDPSHVRDHTIAQWLAMLTAAGLAGEMVFSWPVPLEFDPWVARIHTPAQNVAMLRTLLDGAPREVREALQIQPNYDYCFSGALFRAIV